MLHTRSDGPSNELVRKEKTFRKALITGVAVICENLSGGLFLENVKMEKQRTSDPYPRIAARIMRQGLGGFWAGFWPWGFILGISKGAVLGGSRAFFLTQFLNANWDEFNADLVSGFAAGGCQGIVMSPMLLARTRVNQYLIERAAQCADNKIPNTGLMQEMKLSMYILNEDIKLYGIRTMFIGMPTMIIKRSLDWGTRFLLIRWFKDGWKKIKSSGPDEELSDFERLVCTFTGSGSACFFWQPLDRMMPIIQAAKSDSNQSVIEILKQRVRTEGLLNTLQRGVISRIFLVGWHTSWAVFVSHKMYDWIERRVD